MVYANKTKSGISLSIQPLIKHLTNFFPFEDEEMKLVEKRTTMRRIKRRQMILQEGFPCKHYSFVVKGCFRMYAIDDNGTEHNLQFAAENEWIADVDSFYSDKPSKLFIEAIEPSTIIQIEKQDLYFLFRSIPKLNRVFKITIENKFVELQNRVLNNISSTAQQRYVDFIEQYPNLASRLPNTQIASYLGITPEFLSKVRSDLAKN